MERVLTWLKSGEMMTLTSDSRYQLPARADATAMLYKIINWPKGPQCMVIGYNRSHDLCSAWTYIASKRVSTSPLHPAHPPTTRPQHTSTDCPRAGQTSMDCPLPSSASFPSILHLAPRCTCTKSRYIHSDFVGENLEDRRMDPRHG